MWFQAIVISQLALFCGVGQANREAWGTNLSSASSPSTVLAASLQAGGTGAAHRMWIAKGPSAAGTGSVKGGVGVGGGGAPTADASTKPERSETDLMLEALVRSDGESPNAKRIDRAVAQAKADAKRDQIAPTTVWKDPFAEDPTRPIPVRGRFRSNETKTKELAVVRRELARARAETAVAQADAARAKADAAKAEANAALAQAVAAKHEAVAARAACVDPSAGKHAMSALVRSEQRTRPRDALVSAGASLPRIARKSGARTAAEPTPSVAAGPVAQPPPAASTDPLIVPLADDALVSSHPGGGILVVPITR
jgi:hypothetical protein